MLTKEAMSFYLAEMRAGRYSRTYIEMPSGVRVFVFFTSQAARDTLMIANVMAVYITKLPYRDPGFSWIEFDKFNPKPGRK